MLIPLGFLAGSGGGVASDYELIESVILGSSQSSVTFSSLDTYSSTYKHLQIRFVSKDTVVQTDAAGFWVKLNADTGNNYAWHRMRGQGSAVSSQGVSSTGRILAGITNHASSAANSFGAGVIDILDAFSTTKNKTLRGISGGIGSPPTEINLNSGLWLSTSALTSINISGDSSLASGSRFSIYGIKG
jgi:hypothetical protein